MLILIPNLDVSAIDTPFVLLPDRLLITGCCGLCENVRMTPRLLFDDCAVSLFFGLFSWATLDFVSI